LYGAVIQFCWRSHLVKQTFTARVWKEGDSFIAQCAQVDVASHGNTEAEALSNLREALELYFEPPVATLIPKVASVEVEVGAA
jgi:predicted RNase H-like HicB family nuclease